MGHCWSCCPKSPQGSHLQKNINANNSDPPSSIYRLDNICSKDIDNSSILKEVLAQNNSDSNQPSPVDIRFSYSSRTTSLLVAQDASTPDMQETTNNVLIQDLFYSYADRDADEMTAEALMQFCYDLHLQPEELEVLIFAWKCNARTMCRLTRSEFTFGCRAICATSLIDIQTKLPQLIQQIQNPEIFTDLYRWTFDFGLEGAGRSLLVEVAVALWRLLFSRNHPPMLTRWLDFIEKHSGVKSIQRDTWNVLILFVSAYPNDLSAYDETASWPNLFDEFVAFENDRRNQNLIVAL